MGSVKSIGCRLQGGGSGACSDKACFENKKRRRAPERSVVDSIGRGRGVSDCVEALVSPAFGSSSLSPNRKEFRISSD